MKLGDHKLIMDLLTPENVRTRCHEILEMAEVGLLEYFQFRPENLKFASECVLQEIELRYPDGHVPLHSRWRHFEFGKLNF